MTKSVTIGTADGKIFLLNDSQQPICGFAPEGAELLAIELIKHAARLKGTRPIFEVPDMKVEVFDKDGNPVK